MLSAFQAEPIIELKPRDRSKIESILSHGDQLLVGLSTGSLRIYRVNNITPQYDESPSNDEPREHAKRATELLREYEKFSKYKIEQLAVFKEANILISLSGGLVSIHDLGTFGSQDVFSKAKGASTFATTSNIVNDVTTSVPGLVSRLAVAVKRRLLLWSWHDGELGREVKEIALASGIKSLTWATGTKIVAGLSSNYVLVDIVSQEVKTISGPGSIGGGPEQDNNRLGGVGTGTMTYLGMGSMVPNPLATGLGEEEMLLARDINTQFINRNGEPLKRRQIPWKPAPQAVGYSYPFLLSLQETSKGSLEVRNPRTLTMLQAIDLPGATLLQVPSPNISLAHQGKGFLVASDRIIWRMKGSSYDTQIDSLTDLQSFDEAISLIDMIEDTLIKDGKRRRRDIKISKAQKLFEEKAFREALEIFTEVLAPPEKVIKMYPEIISGSLSNSQTPPNSPVKTHKKTISSTLSRRSKAEDTDHWSDNDLREAVRELQHFLVDIRSRRLQRFFDSDQRVKSVQDLQDGDQVEENLKVLECLLEIHDFQDPQLDERLTDTAVLVDTTLFKVYMLVMPTLAGSLFRIANFCDPEVVMSKLEESERYSDMIDFLYGKRLHRQALEKLQKFGQSDKTEKVDPQLSGTQRTVTYLQNLSPDLIDLILEFARWPVETQPELGMQIFQADTENAEQLPRHRVLSFLESIDSNLALQYLEHVIDELNDDTPELHQKLLALYLAQSKEATGAARDELVDRLIRVLRSSNQYSPARVLEQLPRDDPVFYEASAVVYSKMGQHRQALQIYVFKLHDMIKAEDYCNEVYMEQQTEIIRKQSFLRKTSTFTNDPIDEQSSVYHVLLNLYLNPPGNENVQVGPAIELMAKHGPRLPPNSTLELIPDDLLVKELEFYLRGRMRHATTAVNDSKIVAGMRKVDAIRVSAALLLGDEDPTLNSNGGRQRRVKVDEDRVCRVCYKRLGSSVISVFPDDSVVHLGCASRRQNELAAQA